MIINDHHDHADLMVAVVVETIIASLEAQGWHTEQSVSFSLPSSLFLFPPPAQLACLHRSEVIDSDM